jgi:hypothetical protein
MSNSLTLREFTIPPRREIWSLLGFSNKSVKKSRNFRWNAQNSSILPRSCPTCWDITITKHRIPLSVTSYESANTPDMIETPLQSMINNQLWKAVLVLIRLKRIYNFWCSMLVFTPFALYFVTLHGVFMWFTELTYWQDATVPVSYFLLFLCFKKATQKIFSEFDETKAERPEIHRSFQRTKEEME